MSRKTGKVGESRTLRKCIPCRLTSNSKVTFIELSAVVWNYDRCLWCQTQTWSVCNRRWTNYKDNDVGWCKTKNYLVHNFTKFRLKTLCYLFFLSFLSELFQGSWWTSATRIINFQPVKVRTGNSISLRVHCSKFIQTSVALSVMVMSFFMVYLT